MTSSRDGTIRVWDLHIRDAVICVDTEVEICQLGLLAHKLRFYTITRESVLLWQINHEHYHFSTIGETITTAFRSEARLVASCSVDVGTSAENRMSAARIITLAENQRVYLISPVNGDIITELHGHHATDPTGVAACQYDQRLHDDKGKVVPSLTYKHGGEPCTGERFAVDDRADIDQVAVTMVAFSSALDRVYCVYGDGSGCISVFSTRENPASLVGTWMTLAENKFKYLLPSDMTVLERGNHSFQLRETKTTLDYTHSNTTLPIVNVLLLVGTLGGHLSARDGLTGQEVYLSPRIHTDRIVRVILGADTNIVVTVGADMLIQVWGIGNGVDGSLLTPLQAFYAPLNPHLVAMTTTRIAVVMQDVQTGLYPLYMYDTGTKECLRHAPSDDHSDVTSDLSACRELALFATAGDSGRVKLWSKSCQREHTLHRCANLDFQTLHLPS